MPRIFKYGNILNITFTPDNELNILIYRSPCYLIIYRSHTLLKMVRFFWPTLYIYRAFAHTLLKLYEIYYQIIGCVCALHIR